MRENCGTGMLKLLDDDWPKASIASAELLRSLFKIAGNFGVVQGELVVA